MPRMSSAILFSSILVFTQGVLAQQPAPASTKPVNEVASKGQKKDEQRNSDLLRIRSLVQQIFAFQDVTTKATTIAKLADMLWDDDETYARQLFSKAVDLSSPKSQISSAGAEERNRLRIRVIALIARHDSTWAKHLTDIDRADNSEELLLSEANIDTAYELLRIKPAKSIAFANRSLHVRVFPDMDVFLILLRLKDEAAANALFLNVLNRLVAEPIVDGDTLLRLGTYVFTSPRIAPNQPGVAVVGIGNLAVYDITADRPNVPRELVRAYLEAAAMILTRPVTNDEQRAWYYVAGYLLSAKTQKFAPELTGTITAAMQSLLPHVPKDLTKESTYGSLEVADLKDEKETLKEIEKEQDEPVRDARYLSLMFDAWTQSDFAQARVIAAKISDAEVRNQLAALIDFGTAVNMVEHKSIVEAEIMAAKLPQGIEASVLWLGIAHAHAEAADLPKTSYAINASLAAARKVDDGRRPFLILTAASELAALDPLVSGATLIEAIKEFNEQKIEEKARVQWSQRVKAGLLWREFPLKIKGVEFGLERSIRALSRADLEGTLTALDGLKNEQHRADALLAVTATILKRSTGTQVMARK